MKKDMPLEGLRWSRDSGSALYDTLQNGRSRTGWGAIYYYHKILKSIYKLLWRKYSLQTGIYIAPNSCGKGLSITHVSYVHVDDIVHMGDNCSILPMVLFGKSGNYSAPLWA